MGRLPNFPYMGRVGEQSSSLELPEVQSQWQKKQSKKKQDQKGSGCVAQLAERLLQHQRYAVQILSSANFK